MNLNGLSLRLILRIDNGDVEPSVPSCAFSLISWVSIDRSGHNRYQMKAEYLSY